MLTFVFIKIKKEEMKAVSGMFGTEHIGRANSQITFITRRNNSDPDEMYSGTVFSSTFNVYSRSNLYYVVAT